mgnify:CR=1 FL=1
MTGIQEPRPAQTTRWHVVTGGPSSGKTTTVNLLRGRGYTTTIEHARHYIDLQRITGRSTAEVRARQSEFQRAVDDEFGPRAAFVVTDLSLSGVGYRTAAQAIDDGVPVRDVWLALFVEPGSARVEVVDRQIEPGE